MSYVLLQVELLKLACLSTFFCFFLLSKTKTSKWKQWWWILWEQEQLCLGHENSCKTTVCDVQLCYSVRIKLYQTYLSGNQSPAFYFVLNRTEVMDSIFLAWNSRQSSSEDWHFRLWANFPHPVQEKFFTCITCEFIVLWHECVYALEQAWLSTVYSILLIVNCVSSK